MATLAAAIKMAAVVAARAQLSTEVSLHRLHLPPPAVEWVLSVLRAMLANEDSGVDSGTQDCLKASHTHAWVQVQVVVRQDLSRHTQMEMVKWGHHHA